MNQNVHEPFDVLNKEENALYYSKLDIATQSNKK